MAGGYFLFRFPSEADAITTGLLASQNKLAEGEREGKSREDRGGRDGEEVEGQGQGEAERRESGGGRGGRDGGGRWR